MTKKGPKTGKRSKAKFKCRGYLITIWPETSARIARTTLIEFLEKHGDLLNAYSYGFEIGKESKADEKKRIETMSDELLSQLMSEEDSSDEAPPSPQKIDKGSLHYHVHLYLRYKKQTQWDSVRTMVMEVTNYILLALCKNRHLYDMLQAFQVEGLDVKAITKDNGVKDYTLKDKEKEDFPFDFYVQRGFTDKGKQGAQGRRVDISALITDMQTGSKGLDDLMVDHPNLALRYSGGISRLLAAFKRTQAKESDLNKPVIGFMICGPPNRGKTIGITQLLGKDNIYSKDPGTGRWYVSVFPLIPLNAAKPPPCHCYGFRTC